MKRHQKKSQSTSTNKKGVKVVYISSPMKVKTCASKFRDLVQELTGKDSDAAARPSDFEEKSPVDEHHHENDEYMMMMGNNSVEFEEEEEEDVFRSCREGSFLRMLSSSNLLGADSFHFDHHGLKSFN